MTGTGAALERGQVRESVFPGASHMDAPQRPCERQSPRLFLNSGSNDDMSGLEQTAWAPADCAIEPPAKAENPWYDGDSFVRSLRGLGTFTRDKHFAQRWLQKLQLPALSRDFVTFMKLLLCARHFSLGSAILGGQSYVPM